MEEPALESLLLFVDSSGEGWGEILGDDVTGASSLVVLSCLGVMGALSVNPSVDSKFGLRETWSIEGMPIKWHTTLNI